MNKKDFLDYIKASSIKFLVENERIIITKDQGSIYLNGIETLPGNVEFKNLGGVILANLKEIPETVKFLNNGSLSLVSVDEVPKGFEFINNGDVDLRFSKKLSEGVSFSNKGDVFLNRLNELPLSVNFSNDGIVLLKSLTDRPIVCDAGASKRELVVIPHCGELKIRLGCFFGTQSEAISRIGDYYIQARCRKEYIQKVNEAFSIARQIYNP